MRNRKLFEDAYFEIEAVELQVACKNCGNYLNTTKDSDVDEFMAEHKECFE